MQHIPSAKKGLEDIAHQHGIDALVVKYRHAPGRADELQCLNELYQEIKVRLHFLEQSTDKNSVGKSSQCRQAMLDLFIQKVQQRLNGKVSQDELADQLHLMFLLGTPGCRLHRLH